MALIGKVSASLYLYQCFTQQSDSWFGGSTYTKQIRMRSVAEALAQELLNVQIRKSDLTERACIKKKTVHVAEQHQIRPTSTILCLVYLPFRLAGGCCAFSRNQEPSGKACLCQHSHVKGLEGRSR